MLAGAKLAATPLGTPLTENAIAELKPLVPEVEVTSGATLPGATLTEVAPRDKLKLGGSRVRLIVCVLLIPPPEAVTVKG